MIIAALAALPVAGGPLRRAAERGVLVTPTYPVGVVGAGLVGLAVARQLAQSHVPVVVFEKETAVAQHQSGHNSGVVHAGIYYLPGSAKATLCRRGVELLSAYCANRDLPWDARGKLVVARDEAETAKLREIECRAAANGVPEVRWLDAAAIRELEPDITGRAALLSPTTAIVDYPAIARSLAGDIVELGGQVLTRTPVTRVHRRGDDGVDVSTPGRTHRLSWLVICAGLQADLLATGAGDETAPEIIPFRGEYLRLRPHARGRVRHLIYPVPDPAYPFLGVHLTPRIDGEVDIGPNAVLALAREGYRRRDVSKDQLSRLARSVAFRLAGPPQLAGRPARNARFGVAAGLPRRGPYLPALAGTRRRDGGAGWGPSPGGGSRRVPRR